jgi:hypothetical protein
MRGHLAPAVKLSRPQENEEAMSDITNGGPEAEAPTSADPAVGAPADVQTELVSEAKENKALMGEKAKSLAGSWSRVFIAALIAAVLGSGSAPWEWAGAEAMNFVWSAVSATLLVIYNYLNPKDVRYGVGSYGEQSEQE